MITAGALLKDSIRLHQTAGKSTISWLSQNFKHQVFSILSAQWKSCLPRHSKYWQMTLFPSEHPTSKPVSARSTSYFTIKRQLLTCKSQLRDDISALSHPTANICSPGKERLQRHWPQTYPFLLTNGSLSNMQVSISHSKKTKLLTRPTGIQLMPSWISTTISGPFKSFQQCCVQSKPPGIGHN